MPKQTSHFANMQNDYKFQAFYEMTENHGQALCKMTKVIQDLLMTLVYRLLVLNIDKITF